MQAQILNLMRRLQDEMGLTYLFISHDMSVVRHMSDQIAVMYLGRIVEQAATEVLFADPKHPYTQLLLETIPNVADPRRDRVPQSGEVPSPMAPPSGCTFHPRCPQADARCSAERPEMQTYQDGSRVACHRVAGPWRRLPCLRLGTNASQPDRGIVRKGRAGHPARPFSLPGGWQVVAGRAAQTKKPRRWSGAVRCPRRGSQDRGQAVCASTQADLARG